MSAPVTIDARAAVRRQIGGVERVAIELSERLPALAPGRYAVARPPRALAHRAGHAWEQVVLPLRARGSKLVYCPANLAPAADRRAVVVVHDLAPLRHPEWYGRAYAAWQRALLPVIARRARHLVAVSEFGRRELVELLGIDPARVTVIPDGVGERFRPGAPKPTALELPRPYVLAVGTRIARKNLAALDAAARMLRARGIDLVAAGAGRAYMRAEREPPARPLGYVAERDLPGLYANAEALVMPSVYEGFGLPCLEAMAAGTPVVAADRAALPETTGGAALLADPEDPEAFAAALERLLDDAELRDRLTSAGLARARELTWDRAARATDELLGRLLAEDAPGGA
ncbi:MAG: glycosyltransferase family 4 protein [Thermoleophilaceae bacterium]|nr:glycosyltransferase family 4 protein [Thermoleophilaceae bacterium]